MSSENKGKDRISKRKTRLDTKEKGLESTWLDLKGKDWNGKDYQHESTRPQKKWQLEWT